MPSKEYKIRKSVKMINNCRSVEELLFASRVIKNTGFSLSKDISLNCLINFKMNNYLLN